MAEAMGCASLVLQEPPLPARHVARVLLATALGGCITVQVPPCPCASSATTPSAAVPSPPQPVTLDPATWGKTGHDPSLYTWSQDERVLYAGSPTMRFEQNAGAGAVADLLAANAGTIGSMSASSYHGRRVRFMADVKTDNATVGAHLWLRLDDARGAIALCNMINPVDRRLKGTRDWTALACVLDVPETTRSLVFGLGLSGPGVTWIGSASIQVVSNDVPESPHV